MSALQFFTVLFFATGTMVLVAYGVASFLRKQYDVVSPTEEEVKKKTWKDEVTQDLANEGVTFVKGDE